jgi:hypothetical protein
MAEDANKRIAELQQQRELLQWMIDNQKRVNNGVAAHLKARKELYEYTQMMQEAEKQFGETTKMIADLEEKRIELSEEEEQNLRKLNKDLKKKLDIIGKEIKALKKTLSIRKALVKEVEKGVKALYDEMFTVRKLTNLYLEMDKAIRTQSVSMGLTAGSAEIFRENMLGAAMFAARFNVSLAEIAKIQGDISSGLGTASILTEEEMQRFSTLYKLYPQIGDMAKDLELFGIGSVEAANEFEKMFQDAQAFGLDATKFTKNMGKNLKLMTKYRFRGGLDDLKKATALTQRMRQDMDQFAGFAEKVMRPEGAIEAAASLQVLGGEMARLGDPFMLMSKARNDMAGFTKEVMNATKFTGIFNERTGQFELTANELDRLRELSKITGQQMDDLVVQAREQAQDQRIRAEIRATIDPKDISYLSGLTKFDETGGMFIEVRGEKKDLSKVTQADIEILRQEEATMEEMVKMQMTFKDNLDAMAKMLQLTLLPIMEYLGNQAKKYTELMADWSDSTKRWITAGIIGLTAAFGIAAMFTAGASMGAGFAFTSGVGKLAGGGGGAAMSGSAALGAGKGQMKRLMGTALVIASIGVAVAAVGAGVYFAVKGFAALAKEMKNLDNQQLETLKSIILGVGVGIGLLIAAMVGVTFLGPKAAIAMLALGGSLMMVGIGVGIAAAGISLIISALGTLAGLDFSTLPTFGQLTGLAGGLVALSAASLLALPAMGVLSSLSAMGPGLESAGRGVGLLADNMGKLGENLQTVSVGDNVAELETVISSLNNLMVQTQKTPIKVEVGGRVDGSVNVDIEGSDFRKDLLRDSFFLEELTSKIEQRVKIREKTSGL